MGNIITSSIKNQSSLMSGSSIDFNKITETLLPYLITISIVIFTIGFIIGYNLIYMLSGSNTPLQKRERSLYLDNSMFDPSMSNPLLYLFVTIAALGAIIYVLQTKVTNKNKKDARAGVDIAVALSCALFICSVIFLFFIRKNNTVAIDSYFYILVSALILYFALLVLIILYHNKLNNLNQDDIIKSIDMTDTYNIQNAMTAFVVIYGIYGVLSL